MAEPLDLTDEQLRQLQLIELEMIVEVDRICRKNHIRYSLDGGTMLGAIRHKGFIPWDDDADIIMDRAEYDRFYEACKTDLDNDRFFFQDYRTDKYYRWGYGKMRRKNTEYVRAGQEHMKYMTGVCIDIFPEDHIPDNKFKRRYNYAVNYFVRKSLYSELGMVSADSAFMRWFYRQLYKIPRDKLFGMTLKLAYQNLDQKTELVCHTLCPNPGPLCKYGMPWSSLEKFEQVEFEGMLFSCTTAWDEFLELSYGDYMQLPPVDKQKGHCQASKIELFELSLEEIQDRYRRENEIIAWNME